MRKAYREQKTAPTTMEKARAYRPIICVSQKAMDDSIRRNVHWCMVTRGIAYSLRNAIRIYADASVIRFSLGIYRYTFMTPAGIINKVVAYDDNKIIKPFKVRLGKPVGIMPVHNSDPKTSSKGGVISKVRDDGLIVPNRGGGKKGAKWGLNPKTPDRKKCTRRSSTRWHGLVVAAKKKAA